MLDASLSLDRSFVTGPARRETFGGFVEQMGRGVYTGIFEPEHPTADDNGFRRDVVDLVRELGVTHVRYPGGNFVSGYLWEDGVGPRDQRPTRLDPAWHSIEPNTFGLDEFMRWAKIVDADPMLAVNLGTRGIEAAIQLLEYCNISAGTTLSDLRRTHGAAAPYAVDTWCLGNEMDGPWQLGRKTPHEYGRLAAETARAMRQIDPSVRLVACGSSGPEMPWFGTWERIVLEEAYDQVDYISAHAYYQEKDGDLASFLASGASMDRYIADVVATADHVRAAGRHTKRMAISFDEWNVWYQDRQRPAASWDTGTPRLEDRYTVADAVVVGSMLIALVRNSDRVLSANLAQLVNVIAPIRTEPGGRAWRQTTFHPFAEMARGTRGTVLGTILTTPSHDTPTHGEVPTIDAVAVLDEAAATARIFAVNRSVDEPVRLRVDARDLGVVAASARTIGGENLYAVADADSAATFGLRSVPQVSCDGARVTATLLPASWTSLALALR